MTGIIISLIVLLLLVILIKFIKSKPKSLDDDMLEYSRSKTSDDMSDYSKPSLKKDFKYEASVKCMVANATCSA